MLNPDFPVLNENSFGYTEDLLGAMYDVNTMIQKEHSKGIGYHNPIYKNYFESIMMYSPCPEAAALN